MSFYIKKLILWPSKQRQEPRVIQFYSGAVNVIYGDSRTGKSAVIPIVDYCLGSSSCRIPAGLIRNACEWFGILISDGSEEMLLCRRAPRTSKVTTRMYLRRDREIAVPNRIETDNVTIDEVKYLINLYLNITDEKIGTSDSRYDSRPSYRDEMALIFQPQYLIANPDTLFYKVDEIQHRVRLTKTLPYFMGVITSAQLRAQAELSEVEKEITRVRRMLDGINQAFSDWVGRLRDDLIRASELGLTSYNPQDHHDTDWILAEASRVSKLRSDDM